MKRMQAVGFGCVGVSLFLAGAISAYFFPRSFHWLPKPDPGWKYAGSAEVPSGVAIDGPGIFALRMTGGVGSELPDWEHAYRRLKPGSVLRVLIGGPMGPESFRLHFVTLPEDEIRFTKDSADTVSLFIGGERRMSLKEEKI
ncbi:MAG: hypothetical protein NDI75_13830, partial [Candidatus Didemnitutus sp.]|nr:hypothetical protein [Candidatus Didemnitutus sp.]